MNIQTTIHFTEGQSVSVMAATTLDTVQMYADQFNKLVNQQAVIDVEAKGGDIYSLHTDAISYVSFHVVQTKSDDYNNVKQPVYDADKQPDKLQDDCNHIQPNYYKLASGRQVADVIAELTQGVDGYVGFCVGCIVKYIYRYNSKNGIEDLNKAKKYIDFLQTYYKKKETSSCPADVASQDGKLCDDINRAASPVVYGI